MADNLLISLIIKAIDKATGPLRKVTNNFAAMRKGWGRAQKAFGRAAEMRQAAEGVASFARKARGALTSPIKAFEEFEAAIAELRGVSQLGAEAMARMEAEALRLGKAVGEFDPTGAAKGMTELARASFTEAETMEALPHLLDLSTASTLDLALTIETLTGVMGGYGFVAKDTQRVSDVMTAAANASKTTFDKLAETMSYAGPILKNAGFSFEEAATAAGLLANANLGASRGGTTLIAVMSRLSGAARGPGAKILEEMEIPLTRMVDGVEKFRTLPGLIADINKEIAHLPLGERLKQFGRIFGQQGATGAMALAKAVDGIGLEKLDAAMAATSGRTRQMAEDFRNTGANEAKQLSSAMTTLNISLGRKMKGSIHTVRESVKGLIETIGKWTEAHPDLTKAILITTGLIAGLSSVLVPLMFGLAFATSALGIFAIAFGSTKTGTQVLGWALKGVITKIVAMAGWIWGTMIPAIGAWITSIWVGMIGALKAWAITIWTRAIPATIVWTKALWASVAASLAAAAPFLAVALAIGAITLAIIQLVKYWEKLDFSEVAKGISESLGEEGILGTLKTMFDPTKLQKDLGLPTWAEALGPGAAETEKWGARTTAWKEAEEMERVWKEKEAAGGVGVTETRSAITLKIETDPSIRATVTGMVAGGADLAVDTGLQG